MSTNTLVSAGTTLAELDVTGTAADSIDTAGGIQTGSGNVALINTAGKITALSGTEVADLSGAALTTLNASNVSSGTLANARLPTNVDLGGTLDVTGATTLDSTLAVSVATPLATTHISKASANVPTTGTTSNAHLMLEGTDNAVMIFGQTSGSPYNGWIQQSDKGNYSFNYPLALNPDGGDVYSTAWTDYYSSSTIVGFSSLTVSRRQIMYRTLGDMVWVSFHLEGISNSAHLTFTVPYTAVAIATAHNFGCALHFTYDNSTYLPVGYCLLANNDNVVKCVTSAATTANPGWTTSGTKIAEGEFWYIKA